VFIDKLLFGLMLLSERELALVSYAMKCENNQDTRVMAPPVECNVLKKGRFLLVGVKMQLLPVPTLMSQTLRNFVR
jgi:hypothetical protein